jgi:hypothetical protein
MPPITTAFLLFCKTTNYLCINSKKRRLFQEIHMLFNTDFTQDDYINFSVYFHIIEHTLARTQHTLSLYVPCSRVYRRQFMYKICRFLSLKFTGNKPFLYILFSYILYFVFMSQKIFWYTEHVAFTVKYILVKRVFIYHSIFLSNGLCQYVELVSLSGTKVRKDYKNNYFDRKVQCLNLYFQNQTKWAPLKIESIINYENSVCLGTKYV